MTSPSAAKYSIEDQNDKTPQIIAHRGFKAERPENTIQAFERAIEVGVDALETDIHLTKDQVVVLSHDPTLKRCFGNPAKIVDCDWEYLSQLRTLAPPHLPLPRLQDLLELLAKPENDSIWVILDIKPDNNPDEVIRLISDTLRITPPFKTPWRERVVLGCWALELVPFCQRHLAEHQIVHIGFSIPFARKFLPIPNVSFSLLQQTLMLPRRGPRFIRDARAAHRAIYAWTVNQDKKMIWTCQRHLDGVITDDPPRFKQICDEWRQGQHRDVKISMLEWLVIILVNVGIMIFGRSLRILFYAFTGSQRPERIRVKELAHQS